MVGSLTGAVSSQRVTEEHEGVLSMVGNHAMSVMANMFDSSVVDHVFIGGVMVYL